MQNTRSALPLGSSKNYHELNKNSDTQQFMINSMAIIC